MPLWPRITPGLSQGERAVSPNTKLVLGLLVAGLAVIGALSLRSPSAPPQVNQKVMVAWVTGGCTKRLVCAEDGLGLPRRVASFLVLIVITGVVLMRDLQSGLALRLNQRVWSASRVCSQIRWFSL